MHPTLRAFLSDPNGRIVVAQWPNLPLLAWAALGLAARAADRDWAPFLGFASGAALVTWAYLEITQGDSPFRRMLGALVLVAALVARLP